MASHRADDLQADRVRLVGHRTAQRTDVATRIMELIDQGQNDRQARVVEAHAVVQVARQRHT
jgi:hypothetical protein